MCIFFHSPIRIPGIWFSEIYDSAVFQSLIDYCKYTIIRQKTDINRKDNHKASG